MFWGIVTSIYVFVHCLNPCLQLVITKGETTTTKIPSTLSSSSTSASTTTSRTSTLLIPTKHLVSSTSSRVTATTVPPGYVLYDNTLAVRRFQGAFFFFSKHWFVGINVYLTYWSVSMYDKPILYAMCIVHVCKTVKNTIVQTV